MSEELDVHSFIEPIIKTKKIKVTMSNNKQSSVEWVIENLTLIHALLSRREIGVEFFNRKYNEIVEQGKAMHKEEITTSMEIAFVDGCRFDKEDYISPFEDWNHYYNETFGE